MRRENWKIDETKKLKGRCKHCGFHHHLCLVYPPQQGYFFLKAPYYFHRSSFLGTYTESSWEKVYLPSFHEMMRFLGFRKEGVVCFCQKCEEYSILCPHCEKSNPIFGLKQKCTICEMKFFYPKRHRKKWRKL